MANFNDDPYKTVVFLPERIGRMCFPNDEHRAEVAAYAAGNVLQTMIHKPDEVMVGVYDAATRYAERYADSVLSPIDSSITRIAPGVYLHG